MITECIPVCDREKEVRKNGMLSHQFSIAKLNQVKSNLLEP
jgi:hypothetical protein